jgi:hypothetical protein
MMRLPRALRLAAFLAVLAPLAAPPAGAQGGRPPSRPARGTPAPVDPSKPVPGKFTHPKLRGWINDVPDTGQFLADSVWILRVGPRVTTVGAFIREWFDSYPEYRPSQDSAGRVQFLKNLVNRDVLGLTALALDLPLRFEDRHAMQEARQRSLASAVYQRFVRDSIRVSEAEVRALWETYKYLQRFRHIRVADRNAAERVRRELVSGRIAWSAAVKKYSLATNDKGPDGELGWTKRDRLEPQVAHAIYHLKPGEYSQPVRDREGWHIVQSVERRAEPAPAYEPMRNMLRRQLEDFQASGRTDGLLALLRARIGMEFDSANVRFASSRFGETVKVRQEAMSATFEIDATVPEFTPEENERLLARWQGGGKYTLGDLVHAYHEIPALLRPALNQPEAVFGLVETTVLEPTIAEYGAERGLEQDPMVVGRMRRKQEQLLVERMYQDSVGSRVWVSREDRQAYYQKHRSQFFTYPSVRFAALVRESKAGADSVEKLLRAGRSVADVIAADSAAGRISGSIQSRHQGEQGPYHKSLFEEMRPGDVQVRGPDKNGEYAVIQLISYDPGRQLSYEESQGMIDESLQNQKSDEALQAMIERLKQRYDIAWRPELVTLIRLVDPTTE